MNIKLTNALIPSLDNMTISEGCVIVEGNSIVYVGDTPNDNDKVYDRVIDLKGNLILPGFCNAHTHSAMTFLRSYADDLPLHSWLKDDVFPNEDKLTPEDIYVLCKLAVAEYLTSGITSCFDMYFFPDTAVKAFVDTGFRCTFCGAKLENLEEYYTTLNNVSDLITFKLGFHAEYTTPMEQMKEAAALSQKYKAPVWCHNSETKSEVEGCIERYGMTPTKLMDSIGMFEYGGGGFHCVHVNDEDADIFRRHNMTAVTCPCSNSKLASGIAKLDKFTDRGVNLAIGTDGAASNNALDMFREMYLMTVLQKLDKDDAAAMPAQTVLRAACEGGARAMGLDRCGRIEAGYLADFTVIDMHSPNMRPRNNILKNIVYSGSKSNVMLTAVNGKILYKNGEFFIGEDIEDIYTKAEGICKRIFEG